MPNSTPTALDGLRVVEMSNEKTAWCGKLFVDFGAEVVLVEPPGGDLERQRAPLAESANGTGPGLAFLYTASGKKSIALDLEAAHDRAHLETLLARADIVLEGEPLGHLERWALGFEDLRRVHPECVWTSITPFGRTGPNAGLRGGDLVANATGGALYVTGDPAAPPSRLAGSQALVSAGAAAAASSLIAFHGRLRSGRGQLVDISLQEMTAAVSHISGVGKWLDDGIVPVRNGTSLFASVPSGAYRCQDGLAYLMINRPLHWQALARWIAEHTDHEAVLEPIFEGPSANRIEYRDLLDVFIGDLAEQYAVAGFVREAQARHLAVTPVNDARGVLRDPHLAARGFFTEVTHPGCEPQRQPGPPIRLDAAKPPQAAPAVDQHREEVLSATRERTPAERPFRSASGSPQEPGRPPLAGLRVLEFTAAMAGPWIGRILAYCGADSVRIESKQRPDVVRLYIPPWNRSLGTQPQLSPWFTDWNAGKRFIGLDLTKLRSVELAKRLVARCDVVIDNQSTGVLEKLGLGYDELVRHNPRLVMISTTGYGGSGPNARFVTWGSNIEAVAGLAKLSGPADAECTITQYAYPDALSAMHGVAAVIAALDRRDRCGQSEHILVSQYEVTAAAVGAELMQGESRDPERLGNARPGSGPHGVYPCRGEDRWCAIEVNDDDDWQQLAVALDQPVWCADPRFATSTLREALREEIDTRLSETTRDRDAFEIARRLQDAGVAAGVVQTVEDEYERDPHLRERGFFETIPHIAKGAVVAAGLPVGLTEPRGHSRSSGEALGQDNEAVFGEWLGMSALEVEDEIASGSIERAD